jgi:hypothetical protein
MGGQKRGWRSVLNAPVEFWGAGVTAQGGRDREGRRQKRTLRSYGARVRDRGGYDEQEGRTAGGEGRRE